MNAAWGIFCDRLVEALLNGGYQGALLAVFAAIGLKLMRRANAATRHAILFSTLLVAASLPIFHFIFPASEGSPFGSLKLFRPFASLTEAGNSMDERADGILTNPTQLSGAIETSFEKNEFFPGENLVERLTAYSNAEAAPSNELPNNTLVEEAVAIAKSSETAPPITAWARFSPVLRTLTEARLPKGWTILAASIWLSLALARCVALLVQYLKLRRLKRDSTEVSPSLNQFLETLRSESGIRRAVKLMGCPEAEAPMAIGFLQPAILLPARILAEAPEMEIESVIRHELAHFARGDDWSNLWQQSIKAVFFFHPGILWMSRRLTIEREIACDDHVLAAHAAPKVYALFLTQFAGRARHREWAAAPAAWSNKSQLKERIDMILDSKRNATPKLARARAGVFVAAAIVVATIGLHAGPRLLLAQSSAPTATGLPSATTESGQARAGSPNKAQIVITTESEFEDDGPRVEKRTITLEKDGASISSGIGGLAVSGPRSKTFVAPEDATALAQAEPAPAPVPASAPVAPVAPQPPQPPVAPSSDRVHSRGPEPASTERRLERLEKMVRELLEREKGRKQRIETQIQTDNDFNFKLKGPEGPSRIPSREEIEHIKEQAKREAEQALRSADLASREAQWAFGERYNLPAQNPPGLETRKSLEARRQALQEELETLEQQLRDNKGPRPSAKIERSVKGIKALEEEYAKQQKLMSEKQEEVNRLKKELKIPDFGDGFSSRTHFEPETLRKMEISLVDAEARYNQVNWLLQTLKKMSRAELRKALPTCAPDEGLQHLLADLAANQQKIAVLKESVGDENLDYKAMVSLQSVIYNQIEERIDGILTGLQTTESQFKNQADKLKEALKTDRDEDAKNREKYAPYFQGLRELDNQKRISEAILRRLLQEREDSHLPKG